MQPLWTPSAERIEQTLIHRFMRQQALATGRAMTHYADLHRWSVEEPEAFWSAVWDFTGVVAETRGERVLLHGDRMPGAEWFPDARLNFAQNLLRRRDDSPALVFRGEDKVQRTLTFNELHDEVARLAKALRAAGVVSGDRVGAYLPNMPEAIIGMLAATSIGAIWSSCSPDFGVQGVLDRFGQIEPKVLFCPDGYHYNGKPHDSLAKVRDIVAGLPTLEQVIVVPYIGSGAAIAEIPNARLWQEMVAGCEAGEIDYAQLPFNHPLFIMFSSGTTGVPKCIVHGAGGTLLQHLKEHQLHVDVNPGDRLFYFTTCGWMMWNWLVSGLASGATLLLYDGSPFYPDANVLFDYAAEARMNIFGTSAKYIDAVHKAGARPRETHELSSVRAMLSTGSPLVPESFDFVYRDIKDDICLSSISGGTDIISCFALGSPILPVYRGELQCLGLGLDVAVYNDDGKAVVGEKGELVCRKPFPSMPIGFWNDPDGAKYRAAYFETYPNTWHHGDYVEQTERGGMVFYGRSDAVLNPGGVRIGTAEIYRQVEKLDEVVESIVIGQEWEGDVRVVLFVRLREGLELDEALTGRIRQTIRANTTPRHVPAKVLQVADIPRTKSGKIVELAVRNIVHGQPVKNQEALANPEALELFRNRAELQA